MENIYFNFFDSLAKRPQLSMQDIIDRETEKELLNQPILRKINSMENKTNELSEEDIKRNEVLNKGIGDERKLCFTSERLFGLIVEKDGYFDTIEGLTRNGFLLDKPTITNIEECVGMSDDMEVMAKKYNLFIKEEIGLIRKDIPIRYEHKDGYTFFNPKLYLTRLDQ